MKKNDNVSKIVASQQQFFLSGATRSNSFRKAQLKKLYSIVSNNIEKIADALKADLGKSPYEAYMAETGVTLSEIRHLKNHLSRWNRVKRVRGSIASFPAKCYLYPEPYGVNLIMSPWNYPLMLTLIPLATAIAAGNTAVVKPSRYSLATSKLLKELLNNNFDSNYIHVFEGGHEMNSRLLAEKFNFIFFTGSPNIGKIVMKAASENLTPVCLELGGKSPCFVDESAKIEISAKRIVWGKFLNSSQTCIAPDYVLCDEKIKDKLISALQNEITLQFGENPLTNSDYPKIINEKHFERLSALVKNLKSDKATLKIAPTLVPLTLTSAKKAPVMQEELFGPILPIVSYSKIEEAVAFVQSRPTPLAHYIFSTNKSTQKMLLCSIQAGGVCINDTIMHIASNSLPFGGIGESGIGAYHGKFGFDTFSHYKALLKQSTAVDVPLRYAPFPKKLSILKMLER